MNELKSVEAPRIIAIGDSHVYGRVDHTGGWVSHLRSEVEKRDAIAAVFNLGIGGETSGSLVERLVKEMTPRAPNIVMIGVGTNDSRSELIGGQNTEVPIEIYRRNLLACIDLVKDAGASPILLSIPRLNADVSTKFNGDYYSNDIVMKYVDVQAEISRVKGVHYVDVWSFSKNLQPDDYADLVHLNLNGHKKYADYLFQSLALEFRF